ncbi:MAG: hypothetical protein QOJ07_3608 [Thermoleophilaceae bacterium]|nr:hypothetical protein [Thermoleophilaceae bacterium]
MRRLGAIVFLVLAVAGGVVLGGAGSDRPRTYRVDAIFYNAAHLIPGQLVKIAGAEVGDVTDVVLTDDHRARVEMEVDEGFAPFREDAKCTIRPQSLIGEKFVECSPGTPKARELKGQDGKAPTVPVTHNTVPVDLDLVFDSLRLPYRDRLALIVNELGTGLAGRPRELNDAIRLANPALDETNRVLAILDGDRARLGKLIDASDTVLAELARRKGDVQSFIDRAGDVSSAVADRRGDLDLAVRRLPPLLAELQPTATDLSSLSRAARPVLGDLRTAAPGVRALASDLGPLNDAARPALVRLADMSRTGRHAVRSATPVAKLLAPVARRLPPITSQALTLLRSMHDRGVVEGLQTFTYFAALATARFDRYSHILPSYQIAGKCQQFATAPVEGCDAHFAGGRGAEGGGRITQRHSRRGSRAAAPGAAPAPSTDPPTANPPTALPTAPATPTAPGTPSSQLLDFLLAP